MHRRHRTERRAAQVLHQQRGDEEHPRADKGNPRRFSVRDDHQDGELRERQDKVCIQLGNETSGRKCRCGVAGMHEPGERKMAHPLGCGNEGGRLGFLHGGGVWPQAGRGGNTVAGVAVVQREHGCPHPVRLRVRRTTRVAVKREPVQLQGGLRPCRADGRAEPSRDLQAGHGRRAVLPDVRHGGRPSGLLREGNEAHTGCPVGRMEEEGCAGLGFV